jgi:hypothetical protein
LWYRQFQFQQFIVKFIQLQLVEFQLVIQFLLQRFQQRRTWSLAVTHGI